MPRVKKAQGTGAVRFNMTPLIDIVFLLIIFFMLVSQFTKLELEQVELPVAKTATPIDYGRFRNVVINIKNPDDPEVWIMGKPIDSSISAGIPNSELTQYLQSFVSESGEAAGERKLNVILRADAMIPYEDIARVMLCAGAAKIEGWWITTDIPDEDEL